MRIDLGKVADGPPCIDQPITLGRAMAGGRLALHQPRLASCQKVARGAAMAVTIIRACGSIQAQSQQIRTFRERAF